MSSVQGLPLTIKVLGSHLCGRTEYEWIDAIERLKTIPLEKTLKRLELSYNGLENDQKEIFLDVVCILKGELKYKAIRILESCGFNARIGLRVLEQKSLITISYTYQLRFHDRIKETGWNCVRRNHPYKRSRILEQTSLITVSDTHQLHFHDHIEEMGWNIVRRMHPDEPSKHNRLWIKEEIEDILVNESGAEATRCIKLMNTNLHPTIIMKGLRKMWELRFLYVLKKIRFLDLTCSKLRTFDLRMTPHLEMLDLSGCVDFVELQMPVECPKLKFLLLCESKVSNLYVGLTPSLETLSLRECNFFVELIMPFECSKLKFLCLSGSKLSNLNLGVAPHLETLDLSGCIEFVELNMHVECPKLKFLNLSDSKVCNLNLGLTPSLETLHLTGCKIFVELHMPVECPKLKFLCISGSKAQSWGDSTSRDTRSFWMMLDLKECYCLQQIHAPVGCLKRLVYLKLSGCLRFEYFLIEKRNKFSRLDSVATLDLSAKSLDVCTLHPHNSLPKFQFKCKYDEPLPSSSGNLEKLISFGLCTCTNLESFSTSICGLQHLREFKLQGRIMEALKDLWQLENLEMLTLCMKEIKSLPNYMCKLKCLRRIDLSWCILVEKLPEELGRLECLEELALKGCESLRDIPNSICKMRCLKRLNLHGCILVEKLPQKLGRLECLEELVLKSCEALRDIPNNIFEKLPEELGRSECIEWLDLTGCKSLRAIPNSICKMKFLKGLNLSGCILVEKLPEELGRLECLKKLYTHGAGISRLPHSIYQLKGLRIFGSVGQLESYGFTLSLGEIFSESSKLSSRILCKKLPKELGAGTTHTEPPTA
ncbi:hypothetical protein L1987_01352 [Smallanthus sonchifolius]|uniref:Uncharacterized protein n=1 Tax=Smallanthus sonchifolius TaxID=185202 RepID=A0ACB9K4S6_9ASTR|nr:hypothetical protein L1987_01352 [Smallanthus sonchifolius]